MHPNHLLAIGALGSMELLVIGVLFSPILVALVLTVYFVRKARNRPKPPPLPTQPHEN